VRTARGVLVSRDRDAPAAVPDAAVRRCHPPAQLGVQLQSADGAWRARLARSRRAGGSTRCCRVALPSASTSGRVRAELIRHMACSSHAIAMRRLLHSVHRAALPSASSAGEGAWRAQMARASGVIISRDRDMPVVALGAALRRYPPPVLLGRATAESGRHMVCSSRVIATRQGSTRCCRAALPSASLAGSHGVLAERGQHLACSSRVIAMRLRQPPKLPYGVALRKLSRGERLQSADDTWRVCLAQPRNAGCST